MIAGNYIPPIHLGTKEEIIRGLMNEASSLAKSGFMRNHAKARELYRIQEQLKTMGVDLLEGTEKDEGYLLAIIRHEPNCELDTNNKCSCPAFYRVEGTF